MHSQTIAFTAPRARPALNLRLWLLSLLIPLVTSCASVPVGEGGSAIRGVVQKDDGKRIAQAAGSTLAQYHIVKVPVYMTDDEQAQYNELSDTNSKLIAMGGIAPIHKRSGTIGWTLTSSTACFKNGETTLKQSG